MKKELVLKDWHLTIAALNYSANVRVPHTWNVNEATQHHRGDATYTTNVFAQNEWQDKLLFLSFKAAYHTATVFVNDKKVAQHSGSGYTPFKIELTGFLNLDSENIIAVVVNNAHSKSSLPYDKDFDWADDGGLIRGVSLLICEKDAIDSLQISPKIDKIEQDTCDGVLKVKFNFFESQLATQAHIRITNAAKEEVVPQELYELHCSEATLPFSGMSLWDLENPVLYHLHAQVGTQSIEARFGIREVTVKDGTILLNRKEIYLTGCEWMPGSHPDYGMAEPLEHSIMCLKQLKDSGCRFTRFHWQQDSTLYDWCDENGLLVQEEIPYWGAPKKVTAQQVITAKMQADEMIASHFNHPSIVFWGVGNELGGENAATIAYVDTMVRYFKSKDQNRLVNYVSNTLGTPTFRRRDDATLHGDIAMWNEYLGTWQHSRNIGRRLRLTGKKCGKKPLMITEFGLCEPFFKGGDTRRCEVLQSKIDLYNKVPAIQGYVWFSLNDYRTHLGEEGTGKLRQRVHGSTDLYGKTKPSYALLCRINQKQIGAK